jgi:elongation factor P
MSSGRRSAWTAGVHQGETGEEGAAIGKDLGLSCSGLAVFSKLRYRAAPKHHTAGPAGLCRRCSRPPPKVEQGRKMVKVIASSLRKGNVVEQDGNLHVILTAENVHPGKGNSVTNVNMRRMSDGVKVVGRWRTVEMVEKADVDEREYQFLYADGEGYHFMEPTNYEQIAVSGDIIGDQKVYLADGMKVYLKTFNGAAVGIELPARVTLEIVETEPAVKNQTASSSFKPAVLSNGAKTMVPPHIGVGTRVVVMTEDGSYVERAKD